MAKKKFQSKATAKRFRSIGRALEASRGEIEAQTKRDVQALETAKRQQWEQATATIGALGDITRSENANFQRLTNLEQKARTTRYDAIVKHGESVVRKFETEAKQKQDYADYLRDLAPKRAKLVGDLAEQGMQTVDTIRGVNQWTALKESGLLKQMTDGKAGAHDSVVYSATGEVIKSTNEGDADGANYRQDTSIRLSSHWAQKKFLEWVKENKEALRNDVIQNYNATAGNDKYGEWNAIRVQELGALGLLKKLGVSDTTRNGTDIIEQFSSWGATDKQGFYETRKVGETQGRVSELTTDLKAVIAKKPDPNSVTYKADVETYNKNVQVAFDNLVLAHKNGWFKAEYSGKVLNPNKGGGKYGNTADAVFQALETIADNDRSIEPNNVNERLGQLKTLDLKGDGKTTSLRERFPERWAAFEQHVVDRHIKVADNDKKRKEALGIVFNSEGSQFTDLRKEYEVNGYTLTELGKLHAMIQASGISEKQKALAYNSLGYRPSEYSSSGNLRIVLDHVANGNLSLAIETANKLTASDKNFLNDNDRAFLDTRVVFWKEINQYYEGGSTELRDDIMSTIKEFETNIGYTATTNTTGKKVARLYHQRIIKRYLHNRNINDARENPGDLKGKTIFNDAKAEEDRLWNEKSEMQWSIKQNKYIPVEGQSSPYNPDNPYNYVRAKKQGETNKHIIYVNQATANQLGGATIQGVAESKPDDDQKKGIEDLREFNRQKSLFYKNNPKEPVSPEYVAELISTGIVSESEALNSVHLIGTKEASEIFDILDHNEQVSERIKGQEKELAKLKAMGVDLEEAGFEYKTIDWHQLPAIKALKDRFPDYRLRQLANRAIGNLFPGEDKPVIPLTDDDCTALKARGVTYTPRNARAVSAYASCKAQNITPVSKDVQNTIDSGGNPDQAFYKGMNIPEGFSQYDIAKRYIQDGGLTLVPGFNFNKAVQLGLIPPGFNIGMYYG